MRVDRLLIASSLSHRGGVTTIIEAPLSSGLIQGVSVAFRAGAGHKLESGAIPEREVALHARIIHDDLDGDTMVSTKVAVLRRLLLGGLEDDCECWANSGWRSLVSRVNIGCEYCRLMLECSWIYVRQKEGGYAGSQPIRSALETTTLEERRRRRQGIETDGCC